MTVLDRRPGRFPNHYGVECLETLSNVRPGLVNLLDGAVCHGTCSNNNRSRSTGRRGAARGGPGRALAPVKIPERQGACPPRPCTGERSESGKRRLWGKAGRARSSSRGPAASQDSGSREAAIDLQADAALVNGKTRRSAPSSRQTSTCRKHDLSEPCTAIAAMRLEETGDVRRSSASRLRGQPARRCRASMIRR